MKGSLSEALNVYALLERVSTQVSGSVPLQTCIDNIEARTTVVKTFIRNTRLTETLKPTTYVVIYMTYCDYMNIISIGTAEQILRKSSIVVSKNLFLEMCQADADYSTSMRELMKSENKKQPSRVFGIMEVFCTSDLDVKKNLFALRTEEDMSTFDFETFKRLTLYKFPDMPNDQIDRMWGIIEQSRNDPRFLRNVIGDNYQPPEEFLVDVNLSMRTCSNCVRRNVKLDMCSGCSNAWYCNRECQCMHWSTHKKVCTKHSLS